MGQREVAGANRPFFLARFRGIGGETAEGRPAFARFAALATPGRLIAIGAFGVLLVHTAALVAQVHATSAYFGDDLIGFWRAKALPLRTFLVTPIDVHFIPMHRVASYLVYSAALLDYRAGLAVLVVLHLTTVALLYTFLQRFIGRAASAALVAIYGLHPCLGALFVWWTSGLHRLGYVLCAVTALRAYVNYRNGSRWWLALFAASSACAVGFYSKGVLVPLYVLGMEATLRFFHRSGAPVRRAVLAMALALAIAVGYVVAWRLVIPTKFHVVNLDPGYLVQFMEVGMRLFVPSVVGVWMDSRLSVYVAIYGAVLVLIVASLWASRRAIVPWAALAMAFAANFLLIGAAAAKSGLFGIGTALSDRYYFELAFLVVLFAGMAIGPALERLSAARVSQRRFARPAFAFVLLAALVALSLKSDATFESIRTTRYAGAARAHDYMKNLRGSLASLRAAGVGTLSLRDSPVSRDLIPMGNMVNSNAALLQLMDEPVSAWRGGAFVVQKDGRILPTKR